MLYQVTGPSKDPLTVTTLGRPDKGYEIVVNKPLPDDPLVAYNAGSRRDWLIRRTHPAAVFVAKDRPVSDSPVPERLMVGRLEVVTVQQLIASKCGDV